MPVLGEESWPPVESLCLLRVFSRSEDTWPWWVSLLLLLAELPFSLPVSRHHSQSHDSRHLSQSHASRHHSQSHTSRHDSQSHASRHHSQSHASRHDSQSHASRHDSQSHASRHHITTSMAKQFAKPSPHTPHLSSKRFFCFYDLQKLTDG